MRYLGVLAAVSMLLAVTATAGATSIRDNPSYVASGNLVLGALDADKGYQLTGPFQLNLEYQTGIADSKIDAFNSYLSGLNFPDGTNYYLKVSAAGGLPIGIYDFWDLDGDGVTQEYAPVTAQWTLSYWEGSPDLYQTILAGDILAEVPDDPYLRVLPTGGYRSFEDGGLANEVEVFNGATIQCEVLGYSYTGNLGTGTVLTPKLVPEPLTMAGLALGIGSLATYLRKRK